MTLHGKVEADVEIKAPAEMFHDVFGFRPHHISNVTPHRIQGCDLHEGEWGKHGSVIHWRYVLDGKPCVAKEIIEAIDDKNNSTTFRVIEGDLMEHFKSFRIIVQATPKPEGGSVVHWTFEYERHHDEVDHPETLLKFAVDVSKDIDAHLIEALEKEKGKPGDKKPGAGQSKQPVTTA